MVAAGLFQLKSGPDLCPALATGATDETRLDIRQAHVVRLPVGAKGNATAAPVVGAIDEDAAHAGVTHVAEGDLLGPHDAFQLESGRTSEPRRPERGPRAFDLALTPLVLTSKPPCSGAFFFWPFWAWPAVDPAFQANHLEMKSLPPAAEIGRPNAVRTFVEGPEGWYT